MLESKWEVSEKDDEWLEFLSLDEVFNIVVAHASAWQLRIKKRVKKRKGWAEINYYCHSISNVKVVSM